MINSKLLRNASVLAVVLALTAAPSASFAFPRGGGGGGGAHFGGGGGGGAHFAAGGGGAQFAGGGGMRAAAVPSVRAAAVPNVRAAAVPNVAATPNVAAAPMARPGGGAAWAGRTTAWNGGNWRGGNFRDGFHHRRFFPGVVAGAVIGGAVADSYAYYGGPDYVYGPDYSDTYYDSGYYDTGPEVAVVQGGDASYCAQRYRSYDPASGTYLGYDGQRHPCP